MTNTIQALGVLQGDRADVCNSGIGGLHWITSPLVCGSLGQHISAAEDAARQSAWTVVRQRLDAILSELDAALGVSVNANAYAFLSTNVRFVRAGLPDA